MTFKKNRGFTLIEVMIVVVIVAILASIALPSYNDYVIRSKITQAVQGLSALQTRMEQCFQDRFTYANCTACATDNLNKMSTNNDFNFACITDTTTFTLTAGGKEGPMAPFTYTVNQADAKSTTVSGAPSGWTGSTTCWVTRKGGAC